MTLEDFVELLTVPEWADHRPAMVTGLAFKRTSVESLLGGVSKTDAEAPALVRNLWNVLLDTDPSVHRLLSAVAGGGTVT